MEKKYGKTPANARIDIDYTGKKPKVKFSYPCKDAKKQALSEHSFSYTLIFLFLILWFIPYMFIAISVETFYYKETPSECNVTLDKGFGNVTIKVEGYESGIYTNISNNNYKTFVKGINISCNNGDYILRFKNTYSFFKKDTNFLGEYKSNHLNFLIVFAYFFLIAPLLIYYLNKFITKKLLKSKRYCKWFPKAQANGVLFKTRKKKYNKFYPKDVLENVIIIPRFSNVELDYKTKDDFSKYLTKVKIREYNKQSIYLKTNKKSKLKKDNYKWYAVFYFSKKPKNGYLEVIYQ